MNKHPIFALLLLLFALPAWAEGFYNTEVNQIADELRCPICQGLSVKESDTVIAQNMKNQIREGLEEGKSKEEILDFFQDRYGEWILRNPKKQGFNLLLWITPFVFLIAFAAYMFFRFKSWSAPGETEQAASGLSDAEEAKYKKYFG